MVRKNAKRTFGLVLVSALSLGLLAMAGCDDSECEGNDCNTKPVTTPDDDDDNGVLAPTCEKLCGHVFGDCADDNRIANGDPISDEECVLFCEGLTSEERGCLTNAPCASLVLCLDDPGDRPLEPGK